VYAALLDEGTYLCSQRTMYRLLAASGELREQRNQLRHPLYAKPELLASRPNEVWSWDITKLLGPVKWTYFYLYVLLDIFSRYVVGWMVAERESAQLAKKLIEHSCNKQGIQAGRLTVHADRGSSMTSKPVALLLADLGATKTHSRPHVSNDNPFSEAQFKTLKYRPEFPERFGSLEDALLLRGVLRLVQQSSLSLGVGPAHPGDGALRRSRSGTRATPRDPGGCLCGAPRALRAAAATTSRAAGRGLDQPAEDIGWKWRSTVNCVRQVSQTC